MMRLSEIAAALGAEVPGADVQVDGVSIDSRDCGGNALFIALRGARYDGHDFAAAAAAAGAVAAVVSGKVDAAIPQITVTDTTAALAKLAAGWRRRFAIPLVAVTGSNGKTTVKEMLGAILGAADNTALASRGNFNNHIGVPLTLLRLREHHRFAVVEMGMNRAGEISMLSKMARPTVAVITNAAAAHLEGVGGELEVACAKGEILDGLGEGGVAVLNADDAHFKLWRGMAGKRFTVRSFGLDGRARADVHGDYRLYAGGSDLEVMVDGETFHTRLPLPGRHNVVNALAAAAAALAAGATVDMAAAGLAQAPPVAGRLTQRRGRNGCLILDDSYNANPASARAALEVLCKHGGEQVAVFGDMLELGAAAAQLHRRLGEAARSKGVARLFAFGPLSRDTAAGFGPEAGHFQDQSELTDALRAIAGPRTVFLIKGSRGMEMENVARGLQEE
ncbi:MAG: UDP-N-acetylmuramoyl-tripeptide--D-alanyl-D-alanine ligase [Gammaproteobacteria bacterium]|nr:UDP-N-acetylmuramoyl-tripeptide--D-alanyl-D-alanine ligase [Gammaproteobacteria bacterium]